MDLKLQLIELYPAINEKNEFLTLAFSQGTQQKGSFNINDIINENKTFILKGCELKIPVKFSIHKKDCLLYGGEFTPYNETKWLSSFPNTPPIITYPKKKNEVINTLNENLRLKIKCQIDSSTSSKQKVQVTSNNGIKLTRVKKGKKSSLKQTGISLKGTQGSDGPIEHKSSKLLFEKRSSSKTHNNNYDNNTNLKNNKSCEGGIWGSTIMNKPNNAFDDIIQLTNGQYNNSIIYESNDNMKKNSKFEYNTINSESPGYITKRGNSVYKKIKSKNTKLQQANNNNSPKKFTDIITNSSSKSTSMNNNNNNNNNKNADIIISKLDDKFKKIEESIIDKNFEKGIERDEIIVSSRKKKNDSLINEQYSIKMSNKVKRKHSYEINERKEDNIVTDKINQMLDEKEQILNVENIDDELNEEYENLKGDFNIFYTDDYFKSIDEETLHLEFQLLMEKILELQGAYHKQLSKLRQSNTSMRKNFNSYSEKFININKKLLKLKQKKERAQIFNSLYTFIDNHKLKNESEITKINKEECKIWKPLLSKSSQDKKGKKEQMYNIFEKICGANISKLDNIEQIISAKLLKKIAKHKTQKQPSIDISVTKVKTKKAGNEMNNSNNSNFFNTFNYSGKWIANNNLQSSSSSRNYAVSKLRKNKK